MIGSCYLVKNHSFLFYTVTTSKGEFVLFNYIKAATIASPNKSSGKVKVCTTTNTVFKKCAEYEISKAATATARAYIYSKIKEKMEDYN